MRCDVIAVFIYKDLLQNVMTNCCSSPLISEMKKFKGRNINDIYLTNTYKNSLMLMDRH